MAQLFANNAGTTLNGTILAGAASLVVASAAGFPVIANAVDYFYLTLADAAEDTWEVVKVTATTGTAFTITRGQDGTSALGWASGSTVETRPVGQNFRDTLSAAYARAAALSVAMG